MNSYKLTKLEYELIKKYQKMGYQYMCIMNSDNIIFSNYPIATLHNSELIVDDLNLFQDLKMETDYSLNEIIENITSVK